MSAFSRYQRLVAAGFDTYPALVLAVAGYDVIAWAVVM